MKRGTWIGGIRTALGIPHRRGHARTRRSLTPTRRNVAAFEILEARHLLATLTVNSTLDNVTVGDSLVTLREAIIAANTDTTTDLGHTGSGVDTIQFDAAVFTTAKIIQLSFGELLITQSLTINGPGQDLLTIDAQQNSRIFDITGASTVSAIRGLRLSGGMANGAGGAIRAQGSGALTVDQCTITGNTATGKGGGFYVRSTTTTVIDSVISDNQTTGLNADGGGFWAFSFSSYAPISVSNCVITGNNATGRGGGFFANYDNATVAGSIISGNIAVGRGGGFVANGAAITNSVITDNQVTGYGGGFFIGQGSSSTVVDTLVSGNIATVSAGGFYSFDGVTLTDSQVTDNTGGGMRVRRGTVTLNSSTVNGNHGTTPGGGISVGYSYLEFTDLVLNSTVVTGNSSSARGGVSSVTVT